MIYFLFLFIFLLSAFVLWRWLAHEEQWSGNLAGLKEPVAIFDFDGTICPSFDLFIEQLNALSDEFGHRKIKPEETQTLKGLSAKKVIQAIGASRWKLPFLILKIRKNAQKQLLELDPVPGLTAVLASMKEKGFSLGILTSNSEENVRLYLAKHQIDFFSFIYSGNNIFGKASHLRKILKQSGVKKAFYIGDEARDMDAAKQAGISGIAVAWGYNSPQVLREKTAVLCTSPEQLLFIN